VNLAQAIYGLLIERESGVEGKVPGRHSTDKTMLRLTERHFTERIPPPERKAKPTKRCVMCYKQGKIRETIFCCPDCEGVFCVSSRHTTPSSTVKVKFVTVFKKVRCL
jgi:hypothetical protein